MTYVMIINLQRKWNIDTKVKVIEIKKWILLLKTTKQNDKTCQTKCKNTTTKFQNQIKLKQKNLDFFRIWKIKNNEKWV